jgi:hypothetical protein
VTVARTHVRPLPEIAVAVKPDGSVSITPTAPTVFACPAYATEMM